jgi:aminoglycoside phosphotransferase (APT) family kinase protein
MPAAEIEVSSDLVRGLLAAQQPDLAHLPVRVLANGWDNLLCRLGDELIVRLPRRALAATLVAHEQQWLPTLARQLTLPIPAPIRVGEPSAGYPWRWSIVPFLPGQPAASKPPADSAEAAVVLAEFLASLHTPADPDAPINRYRGVPLAVRGEIFAEAVSRLSGSINTAAVTAAWASALAAPGWHGPPMWLHGDLHPANILVDHGCVSAVIDFGDITAGDPAADLAVAWMLLPRNAHLAFRAAYAEACQYNTTEDLWERARGWALALALVFLANSADNPLMADIGERTLGTVLDSEAGCSEKTEH